MQQGCGKVSALRPGSWWRRGVEARLLLSQNLTSLVMERVAGCCWLDYYKVAEHPTGTEQWAKVLAFLELTFLCKEKKIPEEKMYSVHQILGVGVMRGMLRLSSHGRLPGEIGAAVI